MEEGLNTPGYRGDPSQVKAERSPGNLSAAKPLPVKEEPQKNKHNLEENATGHLLTSRFLCLI